VLIGLNRLIALFFLNRLIRTDVMRVWAKKAFLLCGHLRAETSGFGPLFVSHALTPPITRSWPGAARFLSFPNGAAFS
jgi:hypothetical protein